MSETIKCRLASVCTRQPIVGCQGKPVVESNNVVDQTVVLAGPNRRAVATTLQKTLCDGSQVSETTTGPSYSNLSPGEII